MDAPLSGKQKRESIKFLFDEMRKTVALKKDQQRKDELHKQKLANTAEKHQSSLDIPKPNKLMPKPTNPEAGPNDTIPALLAPGEAVIPAKAAQKPENKPLIKALVREGRSDKNLSVPKPKGMECGTTNMKGYEWGSPEVAPNDVGFHNAELSDSEGYGVLKGYEFGTDAVVDSQGALVLPESTGVAQGETGQWTYMPEYAIDPKGEITYYNQEQTNKDITPKPVPLIDQNIPGVKTKMVWQGNELVPVEVPPTPATVKPVAEGVKVQKKWVGNELVDIPVVPNIEDDKSYTRQQEAGGNYNIGYHYKPDKEGKRISSAWGAYGITEAAYKDIQAANPEFKDKALTSLTPAEQDAAYDTYKGVLSKQLAAKGIEPTEANIRGAHFLGAGGQATFLKTGEVPQWLADANGGQEKAKAIALKRMQGGAAPSSGAVQQIVENKGKVVPPVNENAPVNEVVQPITKDDEGNALPNINQITGQYETPPDTRSAGEKWYDFGKETVVGGLNSIYNNITDPKVLTSNIKDFVTDTLGFNAKDAAKFATLYLAQRGMGVSERGAALFAGKYALQSSDARAAKEQEHINSMVQKGYEYDKKTKTFRPGAMKPEGKTEYKVIDGNTFAFRKFKEGGTGKEEYYLEAPNGQRFTEAQVVGVFKSGSPEQIKALKTLTSVPAEAFSSAQHGDEAAAGRRQKSTEWLGKTIDGMQRKVLGDPTDKKGNPNAKYAMLPDSSVMSSQFQDVLEKYGLDMSKLKDQRVAETAFLQAAEEAVRDSAKSKTKVEDVSFYFEQQMLLGGVGPTKELYKTKDGDALAANKVSNFKLVQDKFGGDRKQAINQMTIWADKFRQDKELQSKWEPSGLKSGFMRYVEDEVKKIK